MVVTEAEGEEAKWQLVRQENGDIMGCASEKLELSSYTPQRNVKKNDLLKHMKEVTVRLRYLEDPAVQALIITDGTFVIGMDPALKMFLSFVGLVASLAWLSCISVQCYKFQSEEKLREQREKRYRTYQHYDATEDEGSDRQNNVGMVDLDG